MRSDQSKEPLFLSILQKTLPVILAGLAIFFIPPAAIAVIAAYFTLPVAVFFRTTMKLPWLLAVLATMCTMISLLAAAIFIALHGLIDLIPIVENHIAPYTENATSMGKLFILFKTTVVDYGHTVLEYAVTAVSTLFQHLFGIFVFLVAYFFALRESGKDQFWFLAYFPQSMRTKTKAFFEEAGKLVGAFLFVEVRLFFITFTIISIGFFFLGFQAPVGTAFLISLVDSLPFLGIGIFLIPMAAFFLYTGNAFVGVSLLLLYLFSIITRQMAESYMWASTFSIKPVHAFFITIAAFYLFGVPGILLTPFLFFFALKIKNHSFFTSP